jgi:hypothetical protein
VQNKRFEKTLVQLGIGALISTMLGIVYKNGEKIHDAVDDKYEREHGVDPNSKKPW